jgi:hypothetical protein
MSDSSEAIAKVVADMRKRRVHDRYQVEVPEQMWKSIEQSVVVDATAIYRDLTKRHGVRLYEDHRAAPVWPNALIGYLNEHGNAIVMHTVAMDRSEYDDTEWERSVDLWSDIVKSPLTRNPWETDAPTHVIDWDRVRWVYNMTIFVGGRSEAAGGAVPTTGPCHMFRLAVYPDGEISDIRWIALDSEGGPRQGFAAGKAMNVDPTGDRWDMAQLVGLGAINLGNCVNVILREPDRPRAAQRRIHRLGVEVAEIHVRPISTSYRGKGKESVAFGSVPLHSVRGHFAEYGMNGRGKLFGKYSGRYWIPAHARGSSEHGTVEQKYVAEGESVAN